MRAGANRDTAEIARKAAEFLRTQEAQLATKSPSDAAEITADTAGFLRTQKAQLRQLNAELLECQQVLAVAEAKAQGVSAARQTALDDAGARLMIISLALFIALFSLPVIQPLVGKATQS